ncbi:MAG: DsrE/DsrF/DrsH-like family protein [Thermoplasmataceae archaeon]
MGDRGLSIIMFSGTADKFIPLGVLVQSAANMEMDVSVFVTGWALKAFTKNGRNSVNVMPKEFEQMAPMLMQGLKEMKAPGWYDMLKSAKEMGNVKIYVCSLMAQAMKVDTQHDLDPIVDDVVGAAAFLEMSRNNQIIFI